MQDASAPSRRALAGSPTTPGLFRLCPIWTLDPADRAELGLRGGEGARDRLAIDDVERIGAGGPPSARIGCAAASISAAVLAISATSLLPWPA